VGNPYPQEWDKYGGIMTEVCVDKKYRIVLPKELRKPFGITAGSVLEAESRKGVIILKPKVPVQKPTEALWGMVAEVCAWFEYHKLDDKIDFLFKILQSYSTLTVIETTYEDEVKAKDLESHHPKLELEVCSSVGGGMLGG